MIANWDTISKYVAPLAGAWIEIMLVKVFHALLMVAPLAGAWIEIWYKLIRLFPIQGRSPRGSVD